MNRLAMCALDADIGEVTQEAPLIAVAGRIQVAAASKMSRAAQARACASTRVPAGAPATVQGTPYQTKSAVERQIRGQACSARGLGCRKTRGLEGAGDALHDPKVEVKHRAGDAGGGAVAEVFERHGYFVVFGRDDADGRHFEADQGCQGTTL